MGADFLDKKNPKKENEQKANSKIEERIDEGNTNNALQKNYIIQSLESVLNTKEEKWLELDFFILHKN